MGKILRLVSAAVLALETALLFGAVQSCGSRTPLLPGDLDDGTADVRPRPPDDTRRVVFEKVDKVDLLFVIDNSGSMADKQALLGQAVPTLLERLINPLCLSTEDRTDYASVAGPEAACPAGFEREFEPLVDLHVGVVTSSLGGHGAELCSPEAPSFNESQDDHAWLLGTRRAFLPSYAGLGFLAWDPAQRLDPPGETNVMDFLQTFSQHVTAAGEKGCGHEATLEAWYRFLVDPNPPQTISVDMSTSIATPEGTDEVLLAQRRAFLRADSLLMIIVLSDEDDCSVVDRGIGWLTTHGGRFNMPASSSACASDPNDPCCRSCALSEDPPQAGCLSLRDDPACTEGVLRTPEDWLNLRCFDQKRRFGWDLLYPVDRYEDGLTELTVYDTRSCNSDDALGRFELKDCALAKNPLFSDRERDETLLVYTSIVGVPWQDIATADSVNSSELEYLTAKELRELDRWSVILGDPENGVLPEDPLMRPSVAPRQGENPITGDELVSPDSNDPQQNRINGHEKREEQAQDLQFSCIFPLDTPRDCSGDDDTTTCECQETDIAENSPLCQPPGGGPAGNTQYFSKAYPGLRHLELSKRLGDSAITASICPKVTTPPLAAPSYGYNPAAALMYERLLGGLGERCLPARLPLTADDQADCVLWQLAESESDCDCEARGLLPIPPEVEDSVEAQLAFVCRYNNQSDDCTSCACALPQLQGRAADACRSDLFASGPDGFCYIDPEQGLGIQDFVQDCRLGEPRTLRLLGRIEDLKESELYLTCHTP